MKKEVCIIGAGLVGSLLAIYMAKRGYKVNVYERRADMRMEEMSAGRSINLALSDRGIKALEDVGILDDIKKIAIPMHGRLMHNLDGSVAYQPYGQEGQFINSVSRATFNQKLMDLAELEGANIHFNETCTNINWETYSIYFTNSISGNASTVTSELIFGSDGAFAASRLAQQLQHNRFQYDQHFINYGYKELCIPAGPVAEFLIQKNALHIWPRGNYMMIALPNIDGSFTCTLFFPFDGDPSFSSIDTKEKAIAFFENNFADAVAMMPTLIEDFFVNPTSSLVTVKCFPWIRDDKFTLIGDAAHAMVPFFGQGMNCGFEDCVVLNKLIDKHQDNWQEILKEFQQLRKPDADAIADMALNNFVEMRDKVADPKFLLQKKIEAAFSKKYPDKWIPAYAQVTFSPHIRYSDALKNGLRQENIMQQIMAMPNIEQLWDSVEVENLMMEKNSE